MSIRTFAAVIGALAAVFGLILLATPVEADATGRLSGVDVTTDCGSVFSPTTDGTAAMYQRECSEARESRGWLGGLIMVGGLVIVAGAAFVRSASRGVGKPAVGAGGEVREPGAPS